MKLSEALKGVKFDLKESMTKYDGTSSPILFIKLHVEEYHGQDYLVLSKTAAENLLAAEDAKAFLSECEVSYSEDAECYGITMPQRTKTLGTFSF